VNSTFHEVETHYVVHVPGAWSRWHHVRYSPVTGLWRVRVTDVFGNTVTRSGGGDPDPLRTSALRVGNFRELPRFVEYEDDPVAYWSCLAEYHMTVGHNMALAYGAARLAARHARAGGAQ